MIIDLIEIIIDESYTLSSSKHKKIASLSISQSILQCLHTHRPWWLAGFLLFSFSWISSFHYHLFLQKIEQWWINISICKFRLQQCFILKLSYSFFHNRKVFFWVELFLPKDWTYWICYSRMSKNARLDLNNIGTPSIRKWSIIFSRILRLKFILVKRQMNHWKTNERVIINWLSPSIFFIICLIFFTIFGWVCLSI